MNVLACFYAALAAFYLVLAGGNFTLWHLGRDTGFATVTCLLWAAALGASFVGQVK